MLVEYGLLLVVFVILIIGKIVSDRIKEQQQWLFYAEQKKMTFPHPQKIRTWEEIPDHYRALFSHQENIPYMLYIPGNTSILFKRKEKLIVLYHDKLVMYEEDPGSGKEEIHFDEILFLEHGKLLFKFWINIACKNRVYHIQYNTKGDDSFSPIITSIRGHSYQGGKQLVAHDDSLESKKLNWLSTMHYKFMNLAKKSILPGQQVADVLFQPSYTLKKIMYLNIIGIKITYTPHLCMTADHELILIQEGKPIRTIVYDQYTSKKFFIPYHNIQTIDIGEDKTNETLQIRLSLNENISLPLSFTKENEQAESFFKKLQQMIQKTTAN